LINDRIKKLEAFSDFNQKLLSILREELKDISEDDSSIDNQKKSKRKGVGPSIKTVGKPTHLTK